MNFTKEKVQGIMDTEVHFKCSEHVPSWDQFKVVATPEGVYFTGRSPVMKIHTEFVNLAKVIGLASTEYLALKKSKAIVTPQSTTQ